MTPHTHTHIQSENLGFVKFDDLKKKRIKLKTE